ncbi:MAG TPA: TRAP transporter small permease subunit, partial [Burkholderiaceae bacterium]|nr:TRAP transporter small permease subunit [Burkholderiaceae bacterium]
LLALSRIIDTVNRWIGAIIIWFVLAAVLISAGNAVLRKLFNVGSNAYLELQWYLFAAVFLLGAGYTFLRNAHVRIDFVSTRLSPRARNWVDILGIVIFLLPLTLLLIRLSWPLVVNAWVSGEMSQNAGGLVRWPVLALLPAGMALLLAQAISELIKRVAFLRGVGPDSIPEEHDPVAAALLAEPSPGEPAR